jgi:TolB-like protein/predicted Zn-dependent protease
MAWVHWGLNQLPELLELVDRSLAIQPTSDAYHLKLMALFTIGELGAARDFLKQVPAPILREDRVASIAYNIQLYSREPAQALAVLAGIPRDILEEGRFFNLRGYLAGNALLLAGKPRAAEVEFRAALKALDERLVQTPRDSRLMYFRARILARLGDKAEATRHLDLARELGRLEYAEAETCVLLGRNDETIASFDRLVDRKRDRWPSALRDMKQNPVFDPLRNDPRFREIAARGDRWLVKMMAAPAKNPGAAVIAPAADNKSAPADKSVAVLPFENRSASGEDAAFLADGIHEDLINTLSRVPGLKVMSRTAVERFRGAKTAMPEIAAALKVSHVVEAGVQRAGNQVRINVQLVQMSDGQTVWSERYDRILSADGIFALQEEITAAIAKALKLQLEPGQETKLITGTTKNLAAYEAFLKGRQLWKNLGASDLEAVAQFKRAVGLDPGFALAYGAMAEAYISVGNSGLEAPARIYPLAKEAAERALAIDPRCIQALTALGEYAFHYEWDWDKAERLLRQALLVDPNYANAYGWLAGHLTMMNRAAEAKVLDQRKAELEPERPLTRLRNELETRLEAKQFAEAIAVARRIADQARGNVMGSFILGSTLRQAGQRQEAIQIMEKAVGEFPDQLKLSEELGLGYAGLGQTAKAREVLGRLATIRETRFVSPLIFAEIAAALNDRGLAFAEIERAFQVRDPFLPGLGTNENMAPLKDDPRFRAVLKRLKLDTVFPEAAQK